MTSLRIHTGSCYAKSWLARQGRNRNTELQLWYCYEYESVAAPQRLRRARHRTPTGFRQPRAARKPKSWLRLWRASPWATIALQAPWWPTPLVATASSGRWLSRCLGARLAGLLCECGVCVCPLVAPACVCCPMLRLRPYNPRHDSRAPRSLPNMDLCDTPAMSPIRPLCRTRHA